jgi:hypothetical protein
MSCIIALKKKGLKLIPQRRLVSECSKTLNCNEDLFVPVEQSPEEKYGFHVNFKHVVMSGLCGECESNNDWENHIFFCHR